MDEATEDNYHNRTSPFGLVSGDKTDGTEKPLMKIQLQTMCKSPFIAYIGLKAAWYSEYCVLLSAIDLDLPFFVN